MPPLGVPPSFVEVQLLTVELSVVVPDTTVCDDAMPESGNAVL